MRVVGLDGREYVLDTRGRGVSGVDARQRSGPHKAARDLLCRVYPLAPVLEEVPLPGSDGLTADFFLPHERTVVEVHGVQHTRYTPHFHGNRSGFLRAMANDRRKAEWCSVNNIRLVILYDTESLLEWRSRIVGAGEAPGDGE